MSTVAGLAQDWTARVRRRVEHIEPVRPPVEGVLRRMVGLTLEAEGCRAPLGARCTIEDGQGGVEAEVVGFAGDRLYLMPTGDLRGVMPNARVVPRGSGAQARVGEELLGRVIDGGGQPIDGGGPLKARERTPLMAEPINPLERAPIAAPLDVGVRSINALFTVGRGQRMGLFAGSGVGKSVLLGMMTRYTTADVVVVGLIGERGREVREFITEILGRHGLARAVVVAAPADTSPLFRLHGAMRATSIAEYFRDQGYNVLLLMDSLTRYAQAQREIGLAIGEPPTTKGYPPSVFGLLPRLVERAGNGADGGGSITAFYTVLVEGDDQQEPIADSARAILDGHLVLSRSLADSGVYPAVDVEASISRAMMAITNGAHQKAAQRFRELYTAYRQNEDLISVGAYQRGSDPLVDQAIQYQPRLRAFLQQDVSEAVDFDESLASLGRLTGEVSG
ncbi:MAG: flagellar protein export ATPase FliI [Halorhodospira halophila]|uniref:flagellar protein export ATPase FliI n=1 Tax=Halorhodospira TaxID=85108 RepID=UPI0019137F0A|nr:MULTISPECIES: flagellar protein export ATPase FliI [Halorhodospira]MBK5936738.1 flagellar protein export ATPase FliI [Halorhodospira halophila]MBK5942818.1 flagellar protein export ATPase FliI [Halorhodospira halophila]MCC3751665.1 flagellar protein export ATPase FliI [Halorhodospira halophila]MCG5528814.1 flagellar protein export ATPase FliI [Halorhodospira halophila]MCG5534322.1 flagellar protein export ATPase FliI [Halorhodospira sp. 9621]